MTQMTGGDAIVRMLHRHGTDTLFGLPGYQSDHFFNALYDAQGTANHIRVINTRHEQGAGYMAYGYARASGRVGVCSVVPGPGMLNATAALATAYATGARVLCLAGQNATGSIGRGLGQLHEIPDSLGILQRLTKWSARAEHPGQVPELINEAFRQLNTGRPRPVALEVPLDMLGGRSNVTLLDAPQAYTKIQPGADEIALAVQLLAGAKHPMIFVGGGANGAGDDLRALAEHLQAPVVSNSNGKGLLSDAHPLSIPLTGGHRLWPQADVVIAVGTRFSGPSQGWGQDANLKVIRIDLDPIEMNRVQPPALGILADAGATLSALRAALIPNTPARASRSAEMNAFKEELQDGFAQIQPQHDFNHALRAALPEDGLFVEELTQVGYASRYMLPMYRERGFIHSGYQGTLGFGFATALGAKVAYPDSPVLSINGDGGFMYNVQELATAAQHKINLVAVVFADGAFGNVQRMQRNEHNGRVIGSTLHNPDFVKLAEAFGIASERVNTPSDLQAAITRGFARKQPTLIEVPVGEMASPWKHVILGRVRP